MIRRRGLLKGLLIYSAISIFAADAAASAEESLYPDSVRSLPDLVVSTLPAYRDMKSPAPVYTLDPEAMRKQGISDIGDAMRRIPGIILKDYGGAGGMKTASVRGFGSQHTGVAVDGITLTEARGGQIDLGRFAIDDTSLELSIGDNDNIFQPARNSAMPAVISLNSFGREPGRRPEITATFRFGSFLLLGGRVRYRQSLSPTFAIDAEGDFTHAGNDYPFTLHNITVSKRERRTNSRLNSGIGRLRMHWRPTGESSLSTQFYYYDCDRQLPGQVRFYTNLSRETLRDRNFIGQTTYNLRISSKLSLRADGKFAWSASDYRDPGYTGNLRDAQYYQREAYVSASLMYTPLEQLALTYAADYAFQNLTSFMKRGAGMDADSHPARHSVLQCLAVRWRPWDRLSVTGRLLCSLYYNHASQGRTAQDAKRLSPSVAMSFRLLRTGNLFVRASYKEIFRMPTFTESYFFHFGNPTLKPENTRQFNVGVTYQTPLPWEGTLRASADGYFNKVSDMIVAVPYNMMIWTNINMGEVKARGADITLNLSQPAGKGHTLLLSGNYSYQRTADRSRKLSPSYNRQIAYTPLNSGGGSLTWSNPWVDVTVSMTAMSARWATNEHYTGTRIPGFAELGFSLFRSLGLGKNRLEIKAELRNALNRSYELVRFYPMPGINYKVSLTWRFDGNRKTSKNADILR